MCFEYIGSGPDILYQCSVQAEPTLYNGRNYWVLDGCPTDAWFGYPECPIIDNNNYIWWSGSSWVHTDTLGGGFVFTTLSNPGLLPIEILGTYEWTSAIIGFATCAPEMRNSFSGPCIPLSATPTPTPTPTITKTPTQTPTVTSTQTPTITKTPTQTPTVTSTPTLTPSSTSVPSIACNGSLVTNGQVGYYEINTEIGTGVGLTYLNCFAGDIPDRFQIYWNNTLVADSLFIGDYLNVNGTTRTNYVNGILGTTSYTKFIYVGSGGNAPGNNQWNTNGVLPITFNNNDIAPNTSTRASGSVGNQLNVSPGYLSPTDKSCDGDVQLFFNKTSAFPTTIKIIVMGGKSGTGGGTTGWSIKKLICPSS
jgi:hypothetical protein